MPVYQLGMLFQTSLKSTFTLSTIWRHFKRFTSLSTCTPSSEHVWRFLQL